MNFCDREFSAAIVPRGARLRGARRHIAAMGRSVVFCYAVLACLAAAMAEVHPTVPAFNSMPGAPYTIYLDFGGFTFNGLWGNNPIYTPGTTPAYDANGNATTFSATELANINNVWSRVSEKYAPFNVNVTTVDPAVAAGQSATDLGRQNYYDSQARMMHTVIGGSGGWTGGGGISFVGTTQNVVNGSNGFHTDWVFAGQNPSSLQFVAEASAHENGHGLKLSHQSDYSGSTLVNEYSSGTGTGAGSKAPIMGNSYTAERGTWKIGQSHVSVGAPQTQNDAKVLLTNSGIGSFVNDGVGHSFPTASPLPVNVGNGTIDASLAKGIIVPSSSANPVTNGEANYVADFWSFQTAGGPATITAHAGRQSITPGVSDPGAMLDATMRILNSSGTVIATSANTTLNEAMSLVLGMGTYYVQVSSAADPLNLGYYDMGSYFITGTIVPVPEPSTWALLASGLLVLAFAKRRRRRG